MRIHDLPPHQRPREKLMEKGADGLSQAELLALVIGHGYRGKSALDIAQRILKTTPLTHLLQLPPGDVARLKGLGLSRAATLLAAVELAKLATLTAPTAITHPADIAAMMNYLIPYSREHVIALYLNARNHLIRQTTISIGTVNSALIHPREVFAPALESKASGVILVHNHPSQDPQPSDEDVTVTAKLAEAGEILDIPLIDHIIVAKGRWVSLKQEQLM